MKIGEIIATETTALVAESYTLNRPPALGSLVRTNDEGGREIYAVVCHVSTGGIDPSRRPIRRSTEDTSDAGVYREHPELEHTLRTEFRALLVGWSDGEGRVIQSLPPQPPPLHYTVHECSQEQVQDFTQRSYYLRLLLGGSDPVPPEQLIVANLRETYECRGRDRAWLRAAAKEIARLSGIPQQPQQAAMCLGCHTTGAQAEEWEKHHSDVVQVLHTPPPKPKARPNKEPGETKFRKRRPRKPKIHSRGTSKRSAFPPPIQLYGQYLRIGPCYHASNSRPCQ